MRIYRLEEADKKKARFINNHPSLEDEQKEYLLNLYLKPEIPDNIIDWQKIKDLTFDELKEIAEEYLKNREDKKSLSKALEGRDYIKIFENKNSNGTEYLYLPLTWVGSKYLASDHFLPKIKVPSKQMQARDFSDNTASNEDLSPGAKWCISLWTIPDYIVWNKPFKDENGKELRHEGKRYWLDYTSGGYYFLFYFRDYKRVKDINKKIALTLQQGSSEIVDTTLADDTKGKITSVIDRIQYYWEIYYRRYESQIYNIQEVSKEEYPKFREYERQKEQEARDYFKSHKKEYTLREFFTYNESTNRYDSNSSIDDGTLLYLIKDGGFTVPLGVIHGNFNCSNLLLKTLKNGPTEVKGNFDCHINQLTTLEGAPRKVGGDFNCSYNNLTTLEYAPQELGGDFNCRGNQLTTLEGAPEKVGGYFEGNKNNLINLKGSPKEVGGSFSCSDNKLMTLEGAPEKVGGVFDCRSNNLTNLKGAPEYVGGSFYCWGNPLQSKELSTEVKGKIFCD